MTKIHDGKLPSLVTIRSPALHVVILLSDWIKYGLAERVCYHFDVVTVHSEDHPSTQEGLTRESVCGVVRLLECVPTTGLSRKETRALQRSLLRFHAMAQTVLQQKQFFCHQPPVLPLRLIPASRVYFAYELTRIAFCLDAKATLTTTFGSTITAHSVCPLDRLADLVRLYFTALIQPVTGMDDTIWKPEIAVSVIAVFPSQEPDIHLLVRDFRVTDRPSAELLSQKIKEWALHEIESALAERLLYRNNVSGRNSYDVWSMPFHSSSLRDILDAADVCLENLSSSARPAVVIATDGSAIDCDSTGDLLWEKDRADLPISVLDLSGRSAAVATTLGDTTDLSAFTLLTADPLGGTYPLHLSDDREALKSVCRASGGVFWDANLLEEGTRTFVGNVNANSPFYADHFFSSPQHTLQSNAVQWYTIFGLSHLTPRPHPTLGVAPSIRDKTHFSDAPVKTLSVPEGRVFGGEVDKSSLTNTHIRTMLSSYIINPVPIKGLIMLRVREGYRVKQYGQSTMDPGKVSIQFTLGLDASVILYYEVAYKSLVGLNNMMGFAHVKIELLGNPSLIQLVKRDFVHGNFGSPKSSDQQVSDRICKLLRWMRKEDTLLSSLTPVRWGDQLKSPESPFVKRLGTLSSLQERRHFRLDEFDCVCVGNMPYDVGEHDFLSDFRDQDDGSEQLIEALEVWSSQCIKRRECFVKQTISKNQSLPAYCVVKIARSPIAGRIWTVTVNTIGGCGASDRLSCVFSLKKLLGKLSHVRVLRVQMGKFLVSTKNHHFGTDQRTTNELMVEKYCDHSTWDLVTDPELLPLLIKRRTEIGNFLLLDSCDKYALLAKIVHKSDARNEPGTLVQYQLSILADKVVVDFHIESESGQFSRSSLFIPSPLSEFYRLVQTLGKRDQECALALQSRRALLQLSNESNEFSDISPLQTAFVQRLLGYASHSFLRMRFFHDMETTANEHLRRLTEQMLLSQVFGPRVAKLEIDPSFAMDGQGSGDWFLVEYDKNTLSIVHLPQEQVTTNVADVSTTHIDMAFFTIGVGDLYSRRDDVVEDGIDDDHITEHMCVTDFTDSLDRGHRRNYASSAYLAALDSTLRNEPFCFAPSDFIQVLNELSFVEVVRVEILDEGGGVESKLFEILSSSLEPVPGDQLCFAYHPSPLRNMLASHDEDGDPTPIEPFDNNDDGDDRNVVKNIEEEDVVFRSIVDGESLDSSSAISVSSSSIGESGYHGGVRPVPLFARILVDDKIASVQDLKAVKRGTSIAVMLSLYTEDPEKASKRQVRELPPSHVSAASDLALLLNAHVAEQHLGRLRRQGSAIGDADLRLARLCLRQARHSVASTVDLYFYVSKLDLMVPASSAARDDLTFEGSFQLLSDQFAVNKLVSLKAFDDGYSFVVLNHSELTSLPYFCFLSIRRSRGLVVVEVHHPDGEEESLRIMQRIQELVSQCAHRTNQILLLERLHASKSASILLIPPDSVATSESSFVVKEKDVFDTGVFQCPILFRTTFDLFHRCATNPLQVARTLEATVLHIFAVSNRMRVFVYKDEQGSIFYMMLSARGGGIEPDGEIELLVHGIDQPGPSITKQLRELLQKKLYGIAVEMLSSVLTKNPRYLWKQVDINFVLTFEEIWSRLDDGDETSRLSSPRVKKYAFPKLAVDPGMVLLYFKQNICGSTFFQQLLAPDSIFFQGLDGNDDTSCVGEDVPNMMFYYNNHSSKLDPEFQGLSTLTKKGAEFSRMTGTGVGLIEVSLINEQGKKVSSLPSIGETAALDNKLSVDVMDIRLIDLLDLSSDEDKVGMESKFFVQIKIYDTVLKREVLHDWLKLTLNQGLAAWTLENLLRRKRSADMDKTLDYRVSGDLSRDEAIECLCPGLPAITSMLESSYNLPHPAVLKFQYDAADLRASNVAKFAFELTNGIILDQMRLESKETLQGHDLLFELCTIRLSRNEPPEMVNLSNIRPKEDEPVDCPEYIIFCLFRQHEKGPPKLFEEVAISDKDLWLSC
ncbi:hypothetical protein FisN_12Hh340 [Fistulifera solaris]|uniref:Uncharacterized protein n=1 Tax=Fistulifera solaris TaxID=1519565 RepID=A0A1Z5KCA4_FISSO|nr:hypothetical protein FisN_12Hh340 [Fistulifera solaris]|eukprot:GAX23762.1 hypothetical protein FisN_12Hh340 [Fistulifera solaris]